MKTQEQKTSVEVYLAHDYNYVVVLTDNESFNLPMYECDFFKTRKQAERFNQERLHDFGEVLTARQAVKKYDFFVK